MEDATESMLKGIRWQNRMNGIVSLEAGIDPMSLFVSFCLIKECYEDKINLGHACKLGIFKCQEMSSSITTYN